MLRNSLLTKKLSQEDLIFIVRNGLFNLAKDMLNSKCINVNLKDDIGDGPIHYCVYNNDTKMLGLLIEHGADLYSANQNNASVYKLAQLHGHKEMCSLILNAGFDEDTFSAINFVENDLH